MSALVIRPEPLPEPNGFQFYINRVLSEKPQMFLNAEQSSGHPLAKELLESGKIKSIFLNEQILKVNKLPESSWDDVFEIVDTALNRHLT